MTKNLGLSGNDYFMTDKLLDKINCTPREDYKNLTCEVRIGKSVPKVTVWHQEALPSDAKL